MVAWWHIFKNLQGIAIHTNGNKIVGHTATYIRIPNRQVAWWQMFQNLQGTAIHTYANKILVVHTVTIPSPLVVALPIQSPMLMPVTYERCSYVLSFGGRCPYLNLNSFASSIQEMFLCSVLSLAHQPKIITGICNRCTHSTAK